MENNINNNDVSEDAIKTAEVLGDVASKLQAYEVYKRNSGTYGVGNGNMNFITNNPLVARFFIYPFLIIVFLVGLGMLFLLDTNQKVVGGIIILVSSYAFICFKKHVKEVKARMRNNKI